MHTFLFLIAAACSAQTNGSDLDAALQRTSAHYAVVLDELDRADITLLAPAERTARARILDALRDYRLRGDFGRAVSDGARIPWFVDPEGRRCAVAELLHVSGEQRIVERVRTSANHAWILDLAGDAEFERWLHANGLAFDEAARIQTPVTTFERGPADTVPSPGATPPPAPDGPVTGSPASGGSSSSTGTNNASSSALAMATSDEDGWWLWWEHAKLEFLVPNRPTPAGVTLTGADAPEAWADVIERARQAELPRLVAATRAREALIRGAAATALGACGGRDATEPLLALMADPNQEVRHRAILALGATGAPNAVSALLTIARTGAVADAKESVSPYARPIAIVALALARRAGVSAPIDAVVNAIVRERKGDQADADSVALAAMFHHVIAPAPALETLALELAFDDHLPPSVRCRATEALGSTRDAAVLARLQTLLSSGRLDLRRSAALALGTTHDARVLAALCTAWELEAEPLTRGFVLVAIGRTGGAKAHAFLAHVLREGKSGDRRWAAVALGVLARETRDPETAKLLRDTLTREKHAAGGAAYWLACGLVRDESVIDLLGDELRTASDPRQRMYAATALGLVGGPRPATILRQRLAAETSAVGRVGIAQALGIVGDPADAHAMRGAIDRLAEPTLQGVASTALAFHGTFAALEELRDLCRAEDSARVRRAASIESLGLILTRSEPFALSLLSRRANYSVMPDWAQAMFQTTL